MDPNAGPGMESSCRFRACTVRDGPSLVLIHMNPVFSPLKAAGLLEGGQTGPGSVFLRVLRCSPVFLPNVDGAHSHTARTPPARDRLEEHLSPDTAEGDRGREGRVQECSCVSAPLCGPCGTRSTHEEGAKPDGRRERHLTDLFVRKQADSVQNPEHSDPPEPDPDPRARPRPRPPETQQNWAGLCYCVVYYYYGTGTAPTDRTGPPHAPLPL
ncbi:hypothetical protein D5F01_LYC14273 [Larimichthys crocea]|uniref:Uncharacterized protein n=1 Tax=Larimichthys crocea TaxID=215358 RepID=A0A6G0IA95_LARCR|nr:hypothetical protein D5F01_LYC14273 [Larimichthys crocea]